MISRQVIVWLVAVIWVAIALLMWLAVIGPANLPVIIAEPVQAGTESKVRNDHAPQRARFTVHDARAENLGRLGEALIAFATAGLDLPTLDINETTEARLSVRSPSRSFVDFVGNGYDYVAALSAVLTAQGNSIVAERPLLVDKTTGT